MIGGQIWFRCHVCSCNLNTREQLLQHKQSPKHQKAEERKRQLGNPGALGGMVGVPSYEGNVQWFPCNICGKRVNSREQLRIHVASHGASGSLGLSGMSGASQQVTATTPGPSGGQSPAQLAGNQLGAQVSGSFPGIQHGAGSSGSLFGMGNMFAHIQGDIGDIDFIPAGTPLKKYAKQETDIPDAGDNGTLHKYSGEFQMAQSILDGCALENVPGSALENVPENIPENVPENMETGSLEQQMAGLSLSTDSSGSADSPLSARCTFYSCYYHCVACDIHLCGPEPKRQHLESAMHKKKEALRQASAGRQF